MYKWNNFRTRKTTHLKQIYTVIESMTFMTHGKNSKLFHTTVFFYFMIFQERQKIDTSIHLLIGWLVGCQLFDVQCKKLMHIWEDSFTA